MWPSSEASLAMPTLQVLRWPNAGSVGHPAICKRPCSVEEGGLLGWRVSFLGGGREEGGAFGLTGFVVGREEGFFVGLTGFVFGREDFFLGGLTGFVFGGWGGGIGEGFFFGGEADSFLGVGRLEGGVWVGGGIGGFVVYPLHGCAVFAATVWFKESPAPSGSSKWLSLFMVHEEAL